VLESGRHRAARKLAERGKIPGFRPGKAPYDVIRRYYGDEAILEQAVDMLVDDIYPKALEEAKVEPAAPGALESIDSMDPLKLTFRVPLKPEVDLGKYADVRLPYEFQPPSEDKLAEEMDSLRQMYATTETVDRAVGMGDYVMVDVKGTNTKPKDGEEAELVNREGMAVLLRKEDKDDEWPFSGFAKKLVGVKPGESKTIPHKFTKDEGDDEFKGKSVDFEATVKMVRSVNLPELNDDFAKMVGEFDTLDKLRETVKANIEERARQEYEDKYYAELIDKVRAGAKIKYPPQVLEHEQEHVLEDMRQRLSRQNIELETYLKVRQTTMEQFMDEEVKPAAITRLERGLILDQLAKDEKVEVDEESVKEEYQSAMAQLTGQGVLDVDKFAKAARREQQQLVNSVAMEAADRIFTRRTLERMKAIATGEAGDKPKKAKKAKAAEDASAEPAAEETAKPKKAPKAKAAAEAPAEAPKKKAAAKKSE
jgi:trigger factor